MDSKEMNDGLHQRIKQEKTIDVNKGENLFSVYMFICEERSLTD